MLDFKTIESPYLIAEIGINHNGDIQIAKKLIDATFSCGWDCAKFQKRNPDVAIPEHQKNILKETPWGTMTYLEYKKKIEFEESQFDYIDKYCKEKPIDWSSSVWDIDSLNFVIKYNPPFIKIPSAMITNIELVTEATKTKIPMIVSTGMSTLEEVDIVVNLLEKNSVSYALMHTNSSYPTKEEELNLRLIPFLADRYHCVVGYSGHEYGLTPTVMAVTLGAKIIERHITLSHGMWGTDQFASLEIEGMDSLKKRIKDIILALGSSEKKVTESEIPIRKKLRGN
jgi:N-acetylneuraminate synthase